MSGIIHILIFKKKLIKKKKVNKTEVDKLDIDILVPVSIDLSKLNDVVKKDVYDKLVAKVNNIDTSGFVLRTKNDTDKRELGKKITDTSGLVKKTD